MSKHFDMAQKGFDNSLEWSCSSFPCSLPVCSATAYSLQGTQMHGRRGLGVIGQALVLLEVTIVFTASAAANVVIELQQSFGDAVFVPAGVLKGSSTSPTVLIFLHS
jgi:hypothetical protein